MTKRERREQTEHGTKLHAQLTQALQEWNATGDTDVELSHWDERDNW